MKFNVSLSPQEKKAVYIQVRDGMERFLYTTLVNCGIDPEQFDETTFEVSYKDGEPEPGHLVIKEHLDRLAELNAKISAL